jgi:hypothetical protein
MLRVLNYPVAILGLVVWAMNSLVAMRFFVV